MPAPALHLLMPYELRGDCVVNSQTGETVKCHPDHASAVAHLRALMANVPEARTAAQLADLGAIVDVPVHPPAAWFDKPDDLPPGKGLTVLDDGRVYGRWYDAGQCLVHSPNECPAPSPTGCAAANQNVVRATAADGETVELRVGVIGQTGGHAHERASIAAAAAHYSDPDRQRILARIGEDEHGGWFAGALVPGLTRKQVEEVRRCATSGDWRKFPKAWWEAHGVTDAQVRAAEGYDTLGPTLVTRPALPLVSPLLRAASADAGASEGDLARFSEPIPPAADVAAYDHPNEERTAAMAEATVELDTSKVEELLLGHAERFEKAMAEIEARLDAIDARNAAADDQRQADAKARAAAVELPDLPAPDGFYDRTWIEYTTADLEWLEDTGRVAAPAPSPASAPDRGAAQRKRDAASGVARPDGSYPIRNAGDLANAKAAIGRAAPGDRAAVIAHINKRAKALGLPGVGQTSGAKAA